MNPGADTNSDQKLVPRATGDFKPGASPCLHHRCEKHRSDSVQEDSRSLSNRSSASVVSSVSGSGLLFLKNYLKKKKSSLGRGSASTTASKDAKNMSFFNSTPLPFPPPPGGYYGPVFVQESTDESPSRRMSVCSTVADLLNEDFDCDDSELKNLDWEEWDEPLPEDMTYDDLVSVISESFYSDDLDLSELCDLDLEGRKTVVANDKDLSSSSGENIHSADSLEKCISRGEASPDPADPEQERIGSSKSRYGGSYKSSSFLQDLEAELELPPMTPVSDEKEEAVRAISRTISKYIRTKSDGSYEGTGSRQSFYSRTKSNASYDEEKQRNQFGRNYSRQEEPGRGSRTSGYEVRTTYSRRRHFEGRESRHSIASPALSEYMPELSTEPSPAPSRRPLSQLLMYDLPSSPTGCTTPDELRYPSSSTTAPPGKGGNTSAAVRSPAQTLTQLQISEILSLPKNEFSLNFEGKSPEIFKHSESGQPSSETRLRNNENKIKNANRDSLLCGAPSYSPVGSPPPAAPRPHLFRHSSSNSTDSGCHLFEDKVPSLSPTPSPRTNIEVLSSNRTKLANFWERSLGGSGQPEQSTWIPGSQTPSVRQGFQPVKSTFGSDNNLGNSQDRLAHFLDVTRRAAEGRRNGRGYFHRASTGSDCSDFFERIPPSPGQSRRRDSFTEYFV